MMTMLSGRLDPIGRFGFIASVQRGRVMVTIKRTALLRWSRSSEPTFSQPGHRLRVMSLLAQILCTDNNVISHCS